MCGLAATGLDVSVDLPDELDTSMMGGEFTT